VPAEIRYVTGGVLLRWVGERGDVETSGECPTRTGDDHDLDVVAVVEPGSSVNELSEGSRAQRVELVGSVEDDPPDGPVVVDPDRRPSRSGGAFRSRVDTRPKGQG